MANRHGKRFHFTGIAGIGMSALAQHLAREGAVVGGSDREASPVSEMLEVGGMKVVVGEQVAANVPSDADVLVYSDAVPEDNPERVRARELGIPEYSYFELLGEVSKETRTVAVAGTHGKTTTTAMLARILSDGGVSPNVIVGSLIRDFPGDSNYLPGESEWFVVEACEYNRHFLNLAPEVLVVTNVEFDHTDYFTDLADVQDAFRTLMERVPARGAIITDTEHPSIIPLLEGLAAPVIHYPAGSGYELKLPGDFNQMNAKAAAAAARAMVPELTDEQVAHALGDFKGAWRRFEYKGESPTGADVYDDYAHHPTAIRETLRALRKKVSGRVIVAFHPHLYSRTWDLLEGFARAFGDADEVIIAPIYSAREDDDGSVSAEILAERIRGEGGNAVSAGSLEQVEEMLREKGKKGDAIMTMGAGDVYKVADALVGA